MPGRPASKRPSGKAMTIVTSRPRKRVKLAVGDDEERQLGGAMGGLRRAASPVQGTVHSVLDRSLVPRLERPQRNHYQRAKRAARRPSAPVRDDL